MTDSGRPPRPEETPRLTGERVRFLSDSGQEYEAEIAPPMLQALRAGYPMKGWPYPWREVSVGAPQTTQEKKS